MGFRIDFLAIEMAHFRLRGHHYVRLGMVAQGFPGAAYPDQFDRVIGGL